MRMNRLLTLDRTGPVTSDHVHHIEPPNDVGLGGRELSQIEEHGKKQTDHGDAERDMQRVDRRIEQA
jgi:hypothetical protein